MDPGMPMMPDPTGGGMPTPMGQPQMDPQTLQRIKMMLLQRSMQGGPMGAGGAMMQGGQIPPMLGSPQMQRPMAPQMLQAPGGIRG